MIIQWPDKILKQVSVPVTDIAQHLDTIKEMVVFVELHHGWGLAAVQVGILERFCVIRYGNKYITLVNPVVIKFSPQTCWTTETCYSVSEGRVAKIMKRRKRVTVRYEDCDGVTHTVKGTGTFGAALQHELDHMDGRTINEYLRNPLAPIAQKRG